MLKGLLSMIIDGAGAQASNYSPRYNTTEKSEPARHKMLKIKSTYVKVSLNKNSKLHMLNEVSSMFRYME